MKHSAILRMASLWVSAAWLAGGAALAQTAPARLTDVGPPPAEDRASVGAIVLKDEPVLARQEHEAALRAGLDTRTMGAAPPWWHMPSREERNAQREAERRRDAERLRRRGAAGLTAQ